MQIDVEYHQPGRHDGTEYHRVLAGPDRRIGRGLAAIGLLLAGLLVLGFVTSQGAALLARYAAFANPGHAGPAVDPLQHAANLIALAMLIPWSMVIQKWLYGIPGKSLHSVMSRFRFDLFGKALVFIGPVWVIVIALSTPLPDSAFPWRQADLVAMFFVILLVTPLQSAGEEYGLRGLVFRVAGSWSRGPGLGLVVGIGVSTLVFVAIHLSLDPWRNVYYLAPAISFAIITWRTGGIETAVVLHALNNSLLFLFEIILHSDFPSLQQRSSGGTVLLIIPAGAVLLIAAIIWVRTRRTGPALSASF